MTNFEWFLLIVVVIGVPLIVAVVVTLWTIDQARKRKRQNRANPQVGVKRKAAVPPGEVEIRRADRVAGQGPGTSSASADVSRETLESTASQKDR
jgi:hypothetical protein